jgi:lipopolysaccharide export system protein LptC
VPDRALATYLQQLLTMLRNGLSLLVICSLLAAFLVLWESPPDVFMRNTQSGAAQPRPPVAIVTNSTTRKFDTSGNLSYLFTAAESRHFQVNPKRATAKDYSIVTAPQLILYKDTTSAPPWNISARQGRVTANGTIVDLHNRVVAWHPSGSGARTEFTTSYLRLQPVNQFAQTDKAVIMRTPGNSTDAVGMKASLKQNTVQLLSNVRGTHEIHR